MDQAKARHVLVLDLIRFAASVMVMGFHINHGLAHDRIPFAWAGWVGVEIFFVLSGYVIAYSAEGAEAFAFASARIVRLYPGVWICGTATAVVILLSGGAPDLAIRYAHTVALFPDGPWIDGVYWTLPIEMAFYVGVFCTLGRNSLIDLQTLLYGLGLGSGVWWLGRLFSAIHWLGPWPESTDMPIVPPIALSLVEFGCYFAIGGMLRACLRSGVTLPRALLLGVSLAAGCIEIGFLAPTDRYASAMKLSEVARIAVPIAGWLAATLLIVLSARFNELAWAWLGGAAPAIRLIGLTTYPLYLLHGAVGYQLAVWLGLGPWSAAAVITVISAIVAAYLEPAVQRRLKRLLAWPASRSNRLARTTAT